MSKDLKNKDPIRKFSSSTIQINKAGSYCLAKNLHSFDQLILCFFTTFPEIKSVK